MTVDVSSETTNISDRAGGSSKVADAANISTGKVVKTNDVESSTLFLDVDGAVNVTLEFSPNDEGDDWYQPREGSPVEFSQANTEIVEIGYDYRRLRLTSDDANVAVTAEVREVV